MSANPRMLIMRLDRLFPTNNSVCKTYLPSILLLFVFLVQHRDTFRENERPST
jgi:hypothetical protein